MVDEKVSALRSVSRAVERREIAKQNVDLAIVAARAAGCTLQAIADAAGITHPMVIHIIRKYE